MKTFKQLVSTNQLIFEKKDHIIKKIPSLSKEQKKEITDFFKKKPNLESKINWNNWKRLTYDDFTKIMNTETTTQKKKRRQKERRGGLQGLQRGKDYIEIKTKNKNFDVYIPLNPKAARVIASIHIGKCHAKWCLANSQANRYYKSEAKRRNLIPVMVIGDDKKWAVMMSRFGTPITIWDQDNEKPLHGEVIPGFSIKRELSNSKMEKLYGEIVDDIWVKQLKPPKGIDRHEYKDAVDAYDELVDDIIDMVEYANADYENYVNAMKENVKDTIEYYEDELDTYKNYELPNAKTDKERKEIEDIIHDLEEKSNRIKSYDDIADILDEYFNSSELDDIDFSNGIYEYERDYGYNATPHVLDSKYEDYFDFVESYYPENYQIDKDDIQDVIHEIENEHFYGGSSIDDQEVIADLEYANVYSPEKMKAKIERIS